MRKLFFLIAAVFFSRMCAGQTLTLGRADTFKLQTVTPYDKATDTLIVQHNQRLVKVAISINRVDSSTILFTTEPIPDSLWGRLNFILANRDSLNLGKISALSGTLSLTCVTPLPQVAAILEATNGSNQSGPIQFDNSEADTLELKVVGDGFYPVSPLDTTSRAPLPQIEDPSMRTLRFVSTSRQEMVLVIATKMSTLPGKKEITLTNFDGRKSIFAFEMKSINEPQITRPTDLTKRYVIKSDTIVTAAAKNPQNIDKIYFTGDGNSPLDIYGFKIRATDPVNKRLRVEILLDELNRLINADADMWIRTKNEDLIDEGKISSYFRVRNAGTPEYLKSFSCFDGDEIRKWPLTSRIGTLDPEEPYVLISKSSGDTIRNVTYIEQPPELEFDSFIKECDNGSWSLCDAQNSPLGVVGIMKVKKDPVVNKFIWVDSVASLAGLFGADTLYASGRSQTYDVRMTIDNLSSDNECLQFLDSLYFEELYKINCGKIVSSSNGEFEVDVPVRIPATISPHKLYYILLRNGDRTSPIQLGSVYVKDYSSPAKPFDSKGFITLHLSSGQTIPLDSANGLKSIEVDYGKEKGSKIPFLTFNSSNLRLGMQHLIVMVRVTNDSDRILQETSPIYEDVAPEQGDDQRLDLKNIQIGEWYSMEIIVRHNLGKYSPVVSADTGLYDVKVRYKGGPWKIRYEASIPFQQASFIFEDSLRVSPFALGGNMVWDHRASDNPQISYWSIGWGAYFADLANILAKQRFALACVLVGEVRPFNHFQGAVGTGIGADLSFSSSAGKTRGFIPVVFQLSYSP
ncbi:MAG TPA: hypothetical protein VLX91_07305 [Candidatus Acidoferrales bacterium]|nr:hypothetical protein [Candidatus Acidoferrales bacterium]